MRDRLGNDPMRYGPAIFLLACGVSACSLPSLSDLPASKVNASWEDAVAPMPCSAFRRMPNGFYAVTGTVTANGTLYVDQTIPETAATMAIAQKFVKHIGPGC